jgi:hypothetical protein
MQNLKKIGIVFAVLVVVIVIAVAFREYWLDALDAFLIWIQGLIGISAEKAFTLQQNDKPAAMETGAL